MSTLHIVAWIGMSLTAFIGMTIFIYLEHPKVWRQSKFGKVIFPVSHFIGILSLILVSTIYSEIEDGFFRTALLYVETTYFGIMVLMLAIYLLRHFILLVYKVFKINRFKNFFCHKRRYTVFAFVLSILMLWQGFYQIDHLKLREYDADSAMIDETNKLKIALIADSHVGGGANHDVLDQMVEMINSQNVDVVLFAGDASDSLSSTSDLKYLSSSLQKLKSTYGVFYTSGNHDKETNQELYPYLESAGVTVLEDEVYTLENGVVLLGHHDHTSTTVEEILEENNISSDIPVIVNQHIPRGIKNVPENVVLTCCGHTHGMNFPWKIIWPEFFWDNPYGFRQFDSMYSVTTSGLSNWGFHFKWPDSSDVTIINLY